MNKPPNHIFESVLLGTGGGYGESQVIHLGNDYWIVIDSCINPETKKSLPLEYLCSIGVDISENVKLVICTHWHDDHIRGMSALLEECNNAVFSMARATDRTKFLRLVGLDFRKSKFESSVSSTNELNKCLEIIERRGQTIKGACEDRLLLSLNEHGIKSDVFALSPSDFIMQEFDREISTLITEYGKTNSKIIIENPNSKSIVIYIKVNDIRVLLGSDLEVDVKSNKKGWLRILDSSMVLDGKSSLFKIPHHGSKNGNHNRIWQELIDESPISKVTPWNRKGKLPQPDMLREINDNSATTLITSIPVNKSKPKKRDRDISKMIRTMKPSLKEVKYSFGQVKCRANTLQSGSTIWSIELDGTAENINEGILLSYASSF